MKVAKAKEEEMKALKGGNALTCGNLFYSKVIDRDGYAFYECKRKVEAKARSDQNRVVNAICKNACQFLLA